MSVVSEIAVVGDTVIYDECQCIWLPWKPVCWRVEIIGELSGRQNIGFGDGDVGP